MSLREADLLEYDLKGVARRRGLSRSSIGHRTRSSPITLPAHGYRAGARVVLVHSRNRRFARLPEHTSRALNREYEDKLVFTVCRRAFYEAVSADSGADSDRTVPLG